MIHHFVNAQLWKITQELCPGTDRYTDSHILTPSSQCHHTYRIFQESHCPWPELLVRTRVIKHQFLMRTWVSTHSRPGLHITTTDHNHPHMAGAMGADTFLSLLSLSPFFSFQFSSLWVITSSRILPFHFFPVRVSMELFIVT